MDLISRDAHYPLTQVRTVLTTLMLAPRLSSCSKPETSSPFSLAALSRALSWELNMTCCKRGGRGKVWAMKLGWSGCWRGRVDGRVGGRQADEGSVCWDGCDNGEVRGRDGKEVD